MSPTNPFQRATLCHSGRAFMVLLASLGLLLAGCADDAINLDGEFPAYLAMGANFPEGASSHLSLVDAWQVRVTRPGNGVVAEDSGSVDPTQQTVTLELVVALQSACEVLTIVIELSSGGQVWFRSESQEEICVGSGNGISAQNLQWVGPLVGLSPSSLPFTLEEGQSPQSQALTVSNPGGGTLQWSASTDQPWLSVSPASGAIGAGQSTQITVTVSDTDLGSGQYMGLITVVGTNAINSPGTVPVNLTYIQNPEIGLSANSLNFVSDEGSDSDPQDLTITNTGGGTLHWATSTNQSWLSLAPTSGSLGPGQSQDVTVSVSSGALPGGVFQGSIVIADPGAANSPRSIPVGLTVTPGPRFHLDPGEVAITGVQGQGPVSRLLSVRNEGGGTLNWTASWENGPWLTLSRLSGSLGPGQSQTITVWANPSGLNPGVYGATILFADPNALNSPQSVPVSFTVELTPWIELSPSILSFTTSAGMNPDPQAFLVENAGGGTMQWFGTSDVDWIELAPASGLRGGGGSAETVWVELDVDDLDEGEYAGSITISSPDAGNSPRTIPVSLRILPRTPPVIANLNVNLIKLNDPTCMNVEGHGSRFGVTFSYTDSDRDLPLSGDSFAGTPVELRTSFPDFGTSESRITAAVEGDEGNGYASFQICVFFYTHNALNIWVALEDSWNLMSNQLYFYLTRPMGANSPSQASGSQGSLATFPGSVLIPGSGGSTSGGESPEGGGSPEGRDSP